MHAECLQIMQLHPFMALLLMESDCGTMATSSGQPRVVKGRRTLRKAKVWRVA